VLFKESHLLDLFPQKIQVLQEPVSKSAVYGLQQGSSA
jgi:hypothetical protein